jgi:hypothetical protein
MPIETLVQASAESQGIVPLSWRAGVTEAKGGVGTEIQLPGSL